jgi:Arc/MetJ-type ribon-helix-helix transcriptional regulator
VPRTFRLTEGENTNLEQQAVDRGFGSASEYLRWLVRNDETGAAEKRAQRKPRRPWDV